MDQSSLCTCLHLACSSLAIARRQAVLTGRTCHPKMTGPLVIGSILGSSVAAYLVFDLISHRYEGNRILLIAAFDSHSIVRLAAKLLRDLCQGRSFHILRPVVPTSDEGLLEAQKRFSQSVCMCRKILGGTPVSDVPSLAPKWREATELRLLGVVRTVKMPT